MTTSSATLQLFTFYSTKSATISTRPRFLILVRHFFDGGAEFFGLYEISMHELDAVKTVFTRV